MENNKPFWIEFYECEHNNDLEFYKADLVKSGAKILDSNIDHDDEVAYVKVEMSNESLANFRKTDSYQFSNL